MYLTVTNFHKGTLVRTNPKARRNVTNSPAQVYTFHLDTRCKVTIRMFASTNAGPSGTEIPMPSRPGKRTLNLYSGTTPSGYTINNDARPTPDPTTVICTR